MDGARVDCANRRESKSEISDGSDKSGDSEKRSDGSDSSDESGSNDAGEMDASVVAFVVSVEVWVDEIDVRGMDDGADNEDVVLDVEVNDVGFEFFPLGGICFLVSLGPCPLRRLIALLSW